MVMQKYRAEKVEVQWIKFSSKLEARVFRYLAENGIEILEFQPKFLLQKKFRYKWEAIREMNYISDFIIKYKGSEIIV